MPFNVTGLPALAVCAGYEAGTGLPLAFQLVGHAFDEATVFSLVMPMRPRPTGAACGPNWPWPPEPSARPFARADYLAGRRLGHGCFASQIPASLNLQKLPKKWALFGDFGRILENSPPYRAIFIRFLPSQLQFCSTAGSSGVGQKVWRGRMLIGLHSRLAVVRPCAVLVGRARSTCQQPSGPRETRW